LGASPIDESEYRFQCAGVKFREGSRRLRLWW